ncbi:MAG TPA: MFS transporter [Gaiellaceae bacterium]|nr:MFS transporter [Gaiellaceae bacterium]
MRPLLAYVRSLNPHLPRSVQILQAGGLANAFGNGLAIPFLFIYLHNVRGIDLGTAGLVVGTNGAVSLVSGPVLGAMIDRVGGRRTLAFALVAMAVGYGLYPFVHEPWQAFAAAAIAGIGNGGFWPSQSSLLAGLAGPTQRHTAFATQRVMMNLGIGLGGLTGGLIATTSNPRTFEALFLLDAATFLVFVGALAFVPDPPRAVGADGRHERAGSYVDVLRNRVFVAVLALNFVFVAAGMAGLETFPAYAKNFAGVGETGIGVAFFLNTVVIVFAQLPIARALEGRRRMATFAVLGIVWAVSWALVPLAGTALTGGAAFALLAFAISLFAVGECLHGTVQAPLVADLADHRLIGRYMALSAWTWSVGFTLGPAVGGYALKHAPEAFWLGAGALCLAAGAMSLLLERALPVHVRRTPGRRRAGEAFGVASGTVTATMDDPLSPDAGPAPHPAHAPAAGLERGHGSA